MQLRNVCTGYVKYIVCREVQLFVKEKKGVSLRAVEMMVRYIVAEISELLSVRSKKYLQEKNSIMLRPCES